MYIPMLRWCRVPTLYYIFLLFTLIVDKYLINQKTLALIHESLVYLYKPRLINRTHLPKKNPKMMIFIFLSINLKKETNKRWKIAAMILNIAKMMRNTVGLRSIFASIFAFFTPFWISSGCIWTSKGSPGGSMRIPQCFSSPKGGPRGARRIPERQKSKENDENNS